MTVTLESLGQEFCWSIEKVAGPMLQAAIQRGLGGVGAGAGLGALGGAGIGTAMGYRRARQEGAGRGQALVQGLGGAGHGALVGAAAGGAGLGVLQAAGAAPGLAGAATRLPGVGAFARSGQRQVHGLTGWTPRGFGSVEGIQQMGAGSADAAKRHAKAFKNIFSGGPKAQAEMAGAAKQLAVTRKAEQMGLTNLPGFAKSLVKHPLNTLRAGAAEQWHGNPKMTAAMVGASGLGVAQELRKKGPDAEGRGGRIAGNLASLATMPLGAMPAMTQMAVGSGLTKAMGKLVPKPVVTSSLGQNPAPPETSPMGSGLASPVERQYSDRASGQIQVGGNS